MRTLAILLLLSLPVWAQPLSLDAALEQALQNQPALQSAEGRILENQGLVEQAQTIGQPTLGLQTSYTFNDPTLRLQVGGTPVDAVVANNWSSTLSFRQVLATFGRLHWATEEAELQKKASQADLQYARARLTESVKTSFYQVLLAQALLKVREDAVKARQAQFDIATKMVGTGSAPGYDAKRDRASLAQAQQDLSEAHKDEQVARAQLGRLLGKSVRAVQSLQQPLTPPPPSAEPDQAWARRKDLEAARWALEAGKAHLELARVHNAPTLSFQSDYGRRNVYGLQPGQLWSTGLVFSIPLYDGGVAEAKSTQAEGAIQQLQAVVDQSRRDIQLEVEAGYSELQCLWQQLDTAGLALTAAQEAARIARLRYQSGFSTNLELLDAEAALTQARQNDRAAHYHYLQAWARWERIQSL